MLGTPPMMSEHTHGLLGGEEHFLDGEGLTFGGEVHPKKVTTSKFVTVSPICHCSYWHEGSRCKSKKRGRLLLLFTSAV